jgi:exosortase
LQLAPRYWWTPIAWLGVLITICYAPVIYRLILHWYEYEDMGHGFFVPIVAGYIIWQKRHRLVKLPFKPNYWGVALLILAGCQVVLGTLAAEHFLARTALIESIVGCILVVCGTMWVRELAFPLFLLVFMVPIPNIIYHKITFPLQLFASQVAESSLSLLGIPVLREGNILELANEKLSVVEACSGIRSLLSLAFLSLVYGYLFDVKPWMRWLLFFATIPIAIVANASRVTLTGIVAEINPEYAHGTYHSISGWVVFVVAMVILVTFHQAANQVYRWTHAK